MLALLDFFAKGRLLNATGAEVSHDRYNDSGVDASGGEIYRRYRRTGSSCARSGCVGRKTPEWSYFFFICEEIARNSRADAESMKEVISRLAKAGGLLAGFHCGGCKAADICTLEDASYLHSVLGSVSKSSPLAA